MTNFEYAFAKTVGDEGGYVDDPIDRGGPTKYGICQREFPHLLIRDLTLADARRIYYDRYWTAAKLEAIRDKYVSGEIFDTAVTIAQRAANFLGASLKEDGVMGAKTAGTLNNLAGRYRLALMCALNLFQGIHYIRVIEKHPSDSAFARGWATRLSLPKEVL